MNCDWRDDWSAMMQAAQQGDAATYMHLLHQVVPLIRNLLRGRLPPANVEDVVQDVLLTLHRVRHTYDPARPFVPWLAAITHRRAIDAERRRRRVRAHEQAGDALDFVSEPAPQDLADPVEAADRAAWLRQAVLALPRQQRSAVELVKLDELSIAEAAARSGQSPGAIRVNVHRGMIALRRLLGGAAA